MGVTHFLSRIGRKWQEVNQLQLTLVLLLFPLAGFQTFLAAASPIDNCSPKMTQPLYQIEKLTWEPHNNQATLTVEGIARTGGWTEICLYQTSNHIFELRGKPPQGMATQALTPVSVRKEINLSNLATDEILVKAETNSKTINLNK